MFAFISFKKPHGLYTFHSEESSYFHVSLLFKMTTCLPRSCYMSLNNKHEAQLNRCSYSFCIGILIWLFIFYKSVISLKMPYLYIVSVISITVFILTFKKWLIFSFKSSIYDILSNFHPYTYMVYFGNNWLIFILKNIQL